jgi:hypothetical protein
MNGLDRASRAFEGYNYSMAEQARRVRFKERNPCTRQANHLCVQLSAPHMNSLLDTIVTAAGHRLYNSLRGVPRMIRCFDNR